MSMGFGLKNYHGVELLYIVVNKEKIDENTLEDLV
jgi:hypothetical protein